MTEENRSTDALISRRRLAEKATPGPWESVYDYCVLPNTYGDRPANVLIADCSREHDNDKQTKANASHIAANSPDVVMADIDEIIRLRKRNERLRAFIGKAYQSMPEDHIDDMIEKLACPWCEGSGHVGDCEEADQQVKKRIERLEKEADWLAIVLACVCCGAHPYEYIDEDVNGMSPPAPEHWREAARNAVMKHEN